MPKCADVIPVVLLGGLTLGHGPAWAGAGDHVRLGSGGELIPSLAVAGVYRTNNYLTVGERFGSDPADAAVGGLHVNIRPQLLLDWKSSALNVGLATGYEARKYINQELSNLDRFRNVNGRLKFGVLPESVVGANVDTSVVVTGRETEAINADDAYLQQMVFRTTGTVAIRPGAAMELNVGGSFEAKSITVPEGFVQNPGAAPTANLNARSAGGVLADFKWQFLPKTALVADFERYSTTWDSNQITAGGAGVGDFAIQADGAGAYTLCDPFDAAGDSDCFLPVPNGVFTSFNAGLRGRFTEKVVIGAVLGFTRADFDSTSVQAPLVDPDTGELSASQAMVETGDPAKCGETGAADGVNDDLRGFPCSLNANLEVRYDFRESQSLTAAFLRDSQPMFFTNYMNMNRYVVGYTGRFADRHVASLNFDFNQQFYRGQVVRDDLWYRARADVDWGLQPWLVLNTGVWYTARRSADKAYSSIEYDDINIHGGLTVSY
jgi:hypothetical protein